jgi:hypothetical protein
MTEYPKPQPGRCELHNCRLYKDDDGYRCWSCESERIEARQRKRAARAEAPGGPNADQVAWARARCSTEVESVLRTEVVRQRARIAELETEVTLRKYETEDAAALSQLSALCLKYGYDGGECGQSLEDWLEERLQRLLELETAP